MTDRIEQLRTSGARLRPLRESDADAAVSVYRCAFGDQRPIDAATIVSWFRNPEVRPEWLRVAEENGQVVGYGDITIANDEVALEVAAPGNWDLFLDWTEQSGRAAGAARARVFFPAGHELAGIVARRGYTHWRSNYTMEVALDTLSPSARPFPEFEARQYSSGDTDTLRSALDEVFANDPFHQDWTPARFREFYLNGAGFDPVLWLLVWDKDELAAFVLAYPEHAGDKSLGWIESLGVRASWRHRGLGEMLLRSAFDALHRRGVRRAGLGVDAENATNAVSLYERVGMRIVRQGDNWILPLS